MTDTPDGGRANLWSVLSNRDFALLLTALVTASMVVWIRILGTAQWLLDETGSAAMVGFIGVVQLVIQIPALLWGGTLADRLDRKKLMSLANATTAITLLTLGFLDFNGALTPAIVYVAIAITAATQMFASPAGTALIPIIIPERLLMMAVSTDTAARNAAAIAGPLLFALVATTVGIDFAFFLGGSIALVAALLPFFIRAEGKAVAETHEEKTSTVQQTLDGLRYVKNHPILPGLFLLDAGITTVSFYREILPVLALGMFAGGASTTGFLGAANSTGAILGSFLALFLASYKAKGMLVLYASFAYGVILFGFGAAQSLVVGIIMIGLLGAADAVTVAVRSTTVMLTTPDAMRGRATSLLILAAQTANNVGTIWVGMWAAAIGAANSMLLGAVLSIVATALIGWYWRPIREFRAD